MSEPTLADRLLTKLRELRDQNTYPLPLTAVIQQTAPDADPAELKKTIGAKKFKSQLQFSVKNKPDAPVALLEDADKLFASDALLIWLLNAQRGKGWKVTLDKLAAKVSADGKDRFLQAVEQRKQSGHWPEGVDVVQADPLILGLTAHKPPPKPVKPPKPPKPEVVLAQRLVEIMGERKARSDNSYPVSLNQVFTESGSSDAKLLNKAVKQATFTSAVYRWSTVADAPLVLVGDEQLLIDSDPLFQYVANVVCTKKHPLASAEEIAALWPQQQQAFLESLKKRLHEKRVPASHGIVHLGGRPLIFSTANPPVPEWLLATQMHEALGHRREGDRANYAISLRTLAEHVDPNADETLLKTAAKQPILSKNVLSAVKGDLDAPAVLANDDAELAKSEAVLLYLVEKSRTDDSQAVALADVKKKLVATLKGTFEDALHERLKTETIPTVIGTLRIKKVLYLFLRRDINKSTDQQPPAPAPLPTPPLGITPVHPSFDEAFDEAFTRLNAARGNVNQVSLVDLRRELSAYPVELFEAGLMSLRRNNRFTLSQAEGQVTPEEEQAAIREDNSLLLHVSRRL